MKINKSSDKKSINLLIYLSFISVSSILNFLLKSEDLFFSSHSIILYTEMTLLKKCKTKQNPLLTYTGK